MNFSCDSEAIVNIDRVLANNPGPFTGPGTNTWVVGDGSGTVVVIDPGPLDSDHESAIVKTVRERKVAGVLVTHTHLDHAPLANPLARNLGVATFGYGPGPQFVPDLKLAEGSKVDVGGAEIDVVFTPGHSDDHLCFRLGNILFTGDHVMGGSSVMVEKMGPYLDSLRKLRGTGLERLLPGHGDEMEEPEAVLDWYLAHRLQRHEQIFESIEGGSSSTLEVVEDVYRDVDSVLYPLAARSVEAHLVLLCDEGRIALEEGVIALLAPQTP
jgi:glyoxylase-like metal-dependent hydrolase (beta-lactamase superfamily II)